MSEELQQVSTISNCAWCSKPITFGPTVSTMRMNFHSRCFDTAKKKRGGEQA